MSSSAESDPAATAVLEKMQARYEGYERLQAEFTLSLEFPGRQAEQQNIGVLRQDDKYRVKMPGRTIISDGETLWLIMEDNQEVQINDVPEEGTDQGILSPQSLFNVYKQDDFVYVLAGEAVEGDKRVQKIEFKPLDRDSDYSKLRLTVEKGSAKFVNLKAFGKDGTQYTIALDDIQPNAEIPAGSFTFNKKDYPDFYVEDLRY